MTRGWEQPALQPSARSLCFARLCQATDYTQPRLRPERRERIGERERQRDEEIHTLRHGQTVSFLSIVSVVTHSLLPHSSTKDEDLHSCFILRLEVWIQYLSDYFLPLFPALSSFLFVCPRRSAEVWLVNPRRSGLIALCITPREKETDLQTDKEREKPGRKKRM